MARVESITGLEHMAARHWRGTEEDRLGGWLLRAAGGFTGRANSALPLGDPGMPLDDALAAVTRWYRARALPPMIVVPLPLEGDSLCHQLDSHLSERTWLTRPGPAFVMVADLATVPPAGNSPADGEFRVDAEPDDPWLATYHYRGQDRQPPVLRTVLMSAPAQAFASIRGDAGEVLAVGRLSIADGWAGITAVEVTQTRRRAGLGMALTCAICAEAAARGARQVFLQVASDNIPARTLYERCGFRYSSAPRSRRHAESGVLGLRPGARYVCNHGYPCVQGLGSFAKRAGRR
jgi:ribosomal protein S18 acetylase RimI-like enzyme